MKAKSRSGRFMMKRLAAVTLLGFLWLAAAVPPATAGRVEGISDGGGRGGSSGESSGDHVGRAGGDGEGRSAGRVGRHEFNRNYNDAGDSDVRRRGDERGGNAGRDRRRRAGDDYGGHDPHGDHRRYRDRYYGSHPDYYPRAYRHYYGPPFYYYTDRHEDDAPLGRSSASHTVVPRDSLWLEGRYAWSPKEDVLEGEFVDVFHPAGHRQLEDGTLELLEEERTTREPKVRIILTKTWIEGQYDPDFAPAPDAADPGPSDDAPGRREEE